jgi:hypothetical protein
MKSPVDLGTHIDKKGTSEILVHPYPARKAKQFQVFFLAPDVNQSVEIVETGEIDFCEIVQRLKMGDQVFIKSANHSFF